jgi:uncharacterized protein
MIDWSRVTGFDWDEGNGGKLEASGRGISRTEVEQMFTNEPLIVSADRKHSSREPRFHALGRTDEDRRLFAAFTLRREDTLVRPISVRVMNAREEKRYEHEA